MPELPEVETLRRGLEREALGERITDVVVANAKVLKGQSPFLFRSRVVGRTIHSVERRGKYLLVSLRETSSAERELGGTPFSAPVLLCVHLKMRGQLLLVEADAPGAAYFCVGLKLASGHELRFHDMWTWGEMRALTRAEVSAVDGLRAMGPEPLEAAWTGTTLASRLCGRKTAIKPALLDQSVVAGVGNIYADESLFRAGIHPERSAGSLSPEEAERLVQAIRAVLHEAIEGGGTTSDNYVDVGGSAGRFVPRVYDRGGAPCVSCGVCLIKIRLGGRGTVFCGRCQA